MRDGACIALTAFKIAAASASAHAASTGVAAKVRDDLRRQPDDARIPLAVLLLCHIAMSIFERNGTEHREADEADCDRQEERRDDERMRVRELCGGRARGSTI